MYRLTQRYKNMMKRRLIYILPLLFVLASCGSSYQFTSQRFQDGIYTRPAAPAEPVYIYSEEEIEAKAAANITLKEYEEAKESAFTSGLYLGMGMSFGYGWHNPWYYNPWYRSHGYWNRWHYNFWADPWDYWYWDSWYWDSWYWDPWYYDRYWHNGWYGGHWHPGYYPVGGRPVRPQYGLSSDGSRYYGSRLDTQVGGSRVSRPGSGRSNYRRGVNSSGSYGSAGSAIISRPSSSSSRPSAVSPSSQGNGNRNYSRVVPGSSQPASTTTRSQNNNYNFNTNTSRSSSSSFGGGSYGGGSYGGGSGGGSRGGGGGGSRGGGRR